MIPIGWPTFITLHQTEVSFLYIYCSNYLVLKRKTVIFLRKSCYKFLHSGCRYFWRRCFQGADVPQRRSCFQTRWRMKTYIVWFWGFLHCDSTSLVHERGGSDLFETFMIMIMETRKYFSIRTWGPACETLQVKRVERELI